MEAISATPATPATPAPSARVRFNAATTLSVDNKRRYDNTKAWLSIEKNQRILLFSLVSLMVLISFAMLWSSDVTINKEDDLNTLKEKNADRVAKLQNLFIVSSITFVLLCGLGFFEVMAYRKE